MTTHYSATTQAALLKWANTFDTRRKAETLRFARRAAQRLLWLGDPGADEAARLP